MKGKGKKGRQSKGLDAKTRAWLESKGREARELHRSLEVLGRKATPLALRVGDLLTEARKKTPHGGWLPFLEKAGLPETSARRYIALASLPAERRSQLSKLPLCEAYIMAGILKASSGKPQKAREPGAPTLEEKLADVPEADGPEAGEVSLVRKDLTGKDLAAMLGESKHPVIRSVQALDGERGACEMLDDEKFDKALSLACKEARSGYVVVLIPLAKKGGK